MSYKKIVFINPNTHYTGGKLSFSSPLNLLYLSSVLLKRGHSVSIIDADIEDLSMEDIREKLQLIQPDMVSITMNTLQTKGACETARTIKEVNSDIQVVVGGVHPTVLKEKILYESPSIDIVVYGEGEITIQKLVESMQDRKFDNIRGICFRRGEQIITNPPQPLIQNLDELPFPAWDLITPIERYPGPFPTGARPTMIMMGSRGCPFSCTFCSSHILWSRKVRFRDPESIVDEVEFLQKKFGIREIFFQDDTFNVNKKWFVNICKEIIKREINKKVIFKCPWRANGKLVDEDILTYARKAGFWLIFYGIESGDERILQNINKKVSLEEAKASCELTKKHGLKIYTSVMIGNIGETKQTVENTLKFSKEINPDFFGVAIATPYPGSQFYKIAKKRGLIEVSDFSQYTCDRPVARTKALSREELMNLANRVQREMGSIMGSIMSPDFYPISLENINSDIIKGYIQMGENDFNQLGFGWYALEYSPPYVRWTEKETSFYLQRKRENSVLFIKALSSHPDIFEKPVIIQAFIDKKPLEKLSIDDTTWTLLSFRLPMFGNNRVSEFTLIVDRTWNPHKFYGTQDNRNLGVVVEKIWLD